MNRAHTFIPLIFLLAMIMIFTSMTSFRDEPVVQDFDVQPFTKIYLKGPYSVRLKQGNECKLRIEAPEKQMERIDVDSGGGMLSVEWDSKDYRKSKNIELLIEFESLERIEILGAVDLESEGAIRTENLKLEFEGAGDVDLELDAEKVITEINGVGSFNLTGKTVYHKVEFSGVGGYDARDLISDFTMVESNGVGSVKVFARKEFKGDANGVGSVDYWGDPEETEINSTGVGSVNRH